MDCFFLTDGLLVATGMTSTNSFSDYLCSIVYVVFLLSIIQLVPCGTLSWLRISFLRAR